MPIMQPNLIAYLALIIMPIMQEQWVQGHADLVAFLALNTMPNMQEQWVRGHADLIA